MGKEVRSCAGVAGHSVCAKCARKKETGDILSPMIFGNGYCLYFKAKQ